MNDVLATEPIKKKTNESRLCKANRHGNIQQPDKTHATFIAQSCFIFLIYM